LIGLNLPAPYEIDYMAAMRFAVDITLSLDDQAFYKLLNLLEYKKLFQIHQTNKINRLYKDDF